LRPVNIGAGCHRHRYVALVVLPWTERFLWCALRRLALRRVLSAREVLVRPSARVQERAQAWLLVGQVGVR
jgi:hypothetical protein